jgi:hypothetical protein
MEKPVSGALSPRFAMASGLGWRVGQTRMITSSRNNIRIVQIPMRINVRYFGIEGIQCNPG